MSLPVIRSATSSDLKKLVELRLCLQLHAEKSNPWVWRVTEEGKRVIEQEFEKTLSDSNSRTVVAEMNGEVVGFALGEVEHRGIGSRLVEKLCQFFIKEKVEQVTLRYIIGNIEAERFWSKLNFEPIITTISIRPEELKERLAK